VRWGIEHRLLGICFESRHATRGFSGLKNSDYSYLRLKKTSSLALNILPPIMHIFISKNLSDLSV
jgi:hypothetical protein